MSFLKHRPRGKHIKSLWPGSSPKTAASADDLPCQLESDARGILLSRRPSDPTPSIKRQRSATTLRSTVSDSTTPVPVTMAKATITFSRPNLHGPVFVVTSLSATPWDVLEMDIDEERSRPGNLVFNRQFDHVPEGTYQYKIRTGGSNWVIDESRETATDELGNRNNVLHVRSQASPSEPTMSTSRAKITSTESEPDLKDDIATLFEDGSDQINHDTDASGDELLDHPGLLFRHESLISGPRQEDVQSGVQTDMMSSADHEPMFEFGHSPTFPHEHGSQHSTTSAPPSTSLNVVKEESSSESEESESDASSLSPEDPSRRRWGVINPPFNRPPTTESMRIMPAPPRPWEIEEHPPNYETAVGNRLHTPTDAVLPDETTTSSFQAVFENVGRFLLSCFGGGKASSGAFVVVGFAAFLVYYLNVFPSR